MKDLKTKEIDKLKGSLKGKYRLWRLGVQKFKEDPPIYRIHLMQGLSVKLTIYMIIFASLYAISIGMWVFSLIILPVGVIGNYYSMKSHLIKYRSTKKQYEIAGLIPSIEKDISPLRKKWRIIESQIGFFGLDITFTLLVLLMLYSYYAPYSLYTRLGIVFFSIIFLFLFYFTIIFKLCNYYYLRRTKNVKQ